MLAINFKRKRSFFEEEENETDLQRKNKLTQFEEPKLIIHFEKKLNLEKIREIVKI